MAARGVTLGSLDRLSRGLGSSFNANFMKNSSFVILTPLCSEITTLEGPAAQVGATWQAKVTLGWHAGVSSG